MSKPLRVLYAAGPGDVIGTYQYWVKGQDDPSQVALTYSGQFYDLCAELDAQAYVISSSQEKKFFRDGNFIIEHRPIPFRFKTGLLYHFGYLWYGIGLVITALRFQANVAVVADGTTHWFILWLLSWLGIKVIPSLHCVLWCKFLPQTQREKLFLKLNRTFFARGCTAILAVSQDISKQISELTNGKHAPIAEFIPVYRRTEFTSITEPERRREPFRVMFAGRIEREKGVFDLLEITKNFVATGRQNILFDICGNGSELESLRIAAKAANVESLFVCHGYCNKEKMHEIYNQAHVVIVPTTTGFIEGFNKVVAESILSGRPVVTSGVCPALSYVQAAVVEVPPNDIQAYSNALIKLAEDLDFYEQKRKNCLALQEQFYTVSRGWGATLKSILLPIQTGKSSVGEPSLVADHKFISDF